MEFDHLYTLGSMAAPLYENNEVQYGSSVKVAGHGLASYSVSCVVCATGLGVIVFVFFTSLVDSFWDRLSVLWQLWSDKLPNIGQGI